MKKSCVVFCLLLTACDNRGIVGKCFPYERSITTVEHDGKIIETKTTDKLLCNCFENQESDVLKFVISKEEFSFENSYSETLNKKSDEFVYITKTVTASVDNTNLNLDKDDVCNKQCTKLCRKK